MLVIINHSHSYCMNYYFFLCLFDLFFPFCITLALQLLLCGWSCFCLFFLHVYIIERDLVPVHFLLEEQISSGSLFVRFLCQ